jgi:HYR domain
MARRGVSATIIAALLGAAVAVGANADGPVLTLDFTLNAKFDEPPCPGQQVIGVTCFVMNGTTVIPGLGSAAIDFNVVIDRRDPQNKCAVWTIQNGTISAAKGTVAFDGGSQDCPPIPEGSGGTVKLQLRGRDALAGGSGDATAVFQSANLATSRITSTWTGTFTVPGHSFDTTPPTLNATTKIVRIRKGRSARVRYGVSAQDAVDGAVPVMCTPASGSRFPLGKTRVTCTATDTSGNTGTTTFFVVVKKRR